jgi:hypothetical protein
MITTRPPGRCHATTSRNQGTGQRANGHEGAENPVILGATVELLLCHQRAGHLEVHAEGADEEHHRNDKQHGGLD